MKILNCFTPYPFSKWIIKNKTKEKKNVKMQKPPHAKENYFIFHKYMKEQ